MLIPVCLALAAGCAQPGYGDAQHAVETREALTKLSCPVTETPVCLERLGHPIKCFCSSKDTLENLLERE